MPSAPKLTSVASSAALAPRLWVHNSLPSSSKTVTKLSAVLATSPLLPGSSAPVTEPATATRPSASTAMEKPFAVEAAPSSLVWSRFPPESYFSRATSAGALDRLIGGALGQVGDHPDRAVRRGRAGADGGDPGGQIGLARPPLDPEGIVDALLGARRRAAVGLELQQLPRALGAGALGHIDRIGRIDGLEADGFAHGAAHPQRPLIRPGRQGDGLGAALDDLGLALDHLPLDAGVDPGGLQRAVDMGDHIVHRPGRGAHVGQVDSDRLRPGVGADGDGELHVALERLDAVAQRAVVDRGRGEGGLGLLQREAGLDRGTWTRPAPSARPRNRRTSDSWTSRPCPTRTACRPGRPRRCSGPWRWRGRPGR